jgi:Na+-translocating ferredoxin:NAD+ oxidoreductase subunit C
MPALLMRLCQHRRPADALAAHLMACVECGTCGYVCPSHIPLVQYIRSGKTQARALQTKQN